MPMVAQPVPRLRPEVRESSRYRASATSAAAAAASVMDVTVTGLRRRAGLAAAEGRVRSAGGAIVVMIALASTIAAITARATAAHGVPADRPAHPDRSPGRPADYAHFPVGVCG